METMKAMVLERPRPVRPGSSPLRPKSLPVPRPGKGQVLIRVSACGVCHTDLDEAEGREKARLPVIPGHQVTGRVESLGSGARRFRKGDRVGVGWIYSSCGSCRFCKSGQENLCESFMATGKDADGGYAEFMAVPEDYAFRLPSLPDIEAAPLLCAGGVGYRSLRLSGIGDGQALGLTGFGACGHLIIQMARHMYPGLRVYVFARSREQRGLARELGAEWAGGTGSRPPGRLDAVIDTTPAWKPPVEALRSLRRGGRLVINAIQKEDSDKQNLMGLDYQRDLWHEKEVKSVANVTRRDITEFLGLASRLGIRPEVRAYSLDQANDALERLKKGHVRGALVLDIANGD
jgi:propanol-preferring alcohol dehydrogenase